MISMIYIIGFLVTFLVELLIEHLYYGNGLSGTVTIKDIMEDKSEEDKNRKKKSFCCSGKNV